MPNPSTPHSELPLCDQPECTREDHLVGYLRAELQRTQEQYQAALADIDFHRGTAAEWRHTWERTQEQLEALQRECDEWRGRAEVTRDHARRDLLPRIGAGEGSRSSSSVAPDGSETSSPASRLRDLTTDDSQNEPPDIRTDDDFEV